MKKSDCTPEEWAAYKAYQRDWRQKNVEAQRLREREAYYRRTDAAKAYRERPEVKERKNLLAREKYAASRIPLSVRDPAAHARKIERQKKFRTGMTPELHALLMKHQDNSCAICKRPFKGRQIRADHCHETGKPRGLLCHHCNIIEGMIRGMGISPHDYGFRLAHYLENPPVRCHEA